MWRWRRRSVTVTSLLCRRPSAMCYQHQLPPPFHFQSQAVVILVGSFPPFLHTWLGGSFGGDQYQSAGCSCHCGSRWCGVTFGAGISHLKARRRLWSIRLLLTWRGGGGVRAACSHPKRCFLYYIGLGAGVSWGTYVATLAPEIQSGRHDHFENNFSCSFETCSTSCSLTQKR